MGLDGHPQVWVWMDKQVWVWMDTHRCGSGWTNRCLFDTVSEIRQEAEAGVGVDGHSQVWVWMDTHRCGSGWTNRCIFDTVSEIRQEAEAATTSTMVI